MTHEIIYLFERHFAWIFHTSSSRDLYKKYITAVLFVKNKIETTNGKSCLLFCRKISNCLTHIHIDVPGNQNPRHGGKNITRTCFLNTKFFFFFLLAAFICVLWIWKKTPEKTICTLWPIDVDLLKNANFIGRVQNKNLFIINFKYVWVMT